MPATARGWPFSLAGALTVTFDRPLFVVPTA